MNKIKIISKYICAMGATGALLFSAAFIYAQTPVRLDELKRGAEIRSEQANQKIKELRNQAQAQIKQARENLQQKVSQIKDKKKQDAANRIVNQIDHVNKVWTDHFTNVLDKLDAALQKIKSRAEKASANGRDVSSTTVAIQQAETVITAARTAVLNQAQKTYTIDTTQIIGTTSTVSSQNNLVSEFRAKFKTLRDQLRKDLNSLRDGAIKDARTAIKNALQALSKVPNVDKEPVASPNNQ